MRNDSAVFFVRHYNDVDHMAPVIWRTSKDRPTRLVVTDDAATVHPLISYFDGESGVEVLHLRSMIGTATNAEGRAAISDLDSPASVLFDGVGSRPAICVDWDYQPFAERIAEAATQQDLVSVSLPHGDAPYINLLINLGDVSGALARTYDRSVMFDHTVVPNSVCAKRYRALPSERCHVLGSARYCREWLAEVPRLVPLCRTSQRRGTGFVSRCSYGTPTSQFTGKSS